ncbi:MAG: DUF3108 domain-containing protein [Acidobacteriaceae bacterium]|nr:DUF3108 domain-containing protein [Acidobacteriaceae bacterium]
MRPFVAAILVLGLSVAALARTPAQRGPRPPVPAPSRPAPRPAPREAAVPFTVGETLTYDVSWSRFIVAGTATTRLIEKRASFGSTAYAVTAEGRPVPLVAKLYPLFYKMDALIESTSLLSQWNSFYTEESTRKHLASTQFDRATHHAHYEISNEPASTLDFPVPPNTQDGLTLLYTLRTRTFTAGDRFSVPVVDNGSMYSVDFATSGPERVTVPLGSLDAWKMALRITNAEKNQVGGAIAVWFSSDARHVPVKIEAELPVGTFMLALREAR